MFIVPPGGFAGFSQMTPASRAALGARTGGATSTGRRRKAKKSKPKGRASGKRRASAKKGGRKMKFGSPAWQKKYKVGKYRK